MYKITHDSMKNRDSTAILTNIHSKFEANPCRGLREEVEKTKKVHASAAADDDNNDDIDVHRVIARATLTR